MEYTVHNTPYDWEGLVRQMVYLGGAPEGSSYVASQPGGGYPHRRAGRRLPGGRAPAPGHGRTLQAFSGAERLSLRCDGQELTAAGKTAQDFLKASLPITRTAEVDYRE